VEEAKYSAPVQTVPGAYPDFLQNGYRIYFPEVKRPGRGGDHSSQSSAEVKEIVQQYLYLPPGTSWPVLGCHSKHMVPYTGCPRRNVPDFGRVFLMLKYTDITQNTYVQS